MAMHHRDLQHRTTLSLAALLAAASLGCGSAKGSDAEHPNVFGGQGADVATPKQTPLSNAPADADLGPCAAGAPAADQRLIDDFEDGDNKIFKAYQREGWLYVAADDTQGQVFPAKGELRPVRLPDASTPDQQFALHGAASGFTSWGVTWGTTLRWVNDGAKCPLNVSNFTGLRFRARGKGTFLVRLGTWDTVPEEFEGKCKTRCWDTHSKRIYLSEQWQTHVVLWEQLQQFGWGAEARFDPKHVLNLNFAAEPKDMPLELWIDDIEFINAEQAALAATPPSDVHVEPPPPSEAPASKAAPPVTAQPPQAK